MIINPTTVTETEDEHYDRRAAESQAQQDGQETPEDFDLH